MSLETNTSSAVQCASTNSVQHDHDEPFQGLLVADCPIDEPVAFEDDEMEDDELQNVQAADEPVDCLRLLIRPAYR